MKHMYTPRAVHVKCVANMYHEPFHYGLGAVEEHATSENSGDWSDSSEESNGVLSVPSGIDDETIVSWQSYLEGIKFNS